MRSPGAGLTVLLYFPNEKNTLFGDVSPIYYYHLLPSFMLKLERLIKVAIFYQDFSAPAKTRRFA